MNSYRIIDTPTLVDCNHASVQKNQNRTLTDEFIERLDPYGTHVVCFSMEHKNWEGTPGIRAEILCKVRASMMPQRVWLDFEPEHFLALSKVAAE